MPTKIRVLVFPINKHPYIAEIEKGRTLKGLQGLVGGYIEAVNIEETLDGVLSMYGNEEALLIDLPPNRLVSGVPMHGQLVMSRVDNDGETISITEKDIRNYWNAFPMAILVRLPLPDDMN